MTRQELAKILPKEKIIDCYCLAGGRCAEAAALLKPLGYDVRAIKPGYPQLVKAGFPDATLVYPAHGAGSMCGKSLSKETVSTIGEQKTFNYALQPMSREAFKAIVTADQPEAPDYFVHDAILNRRERASLDAAMQKTLKPLSLDEVLALANSGGQLLDVRDGIDSEGGHLRGALNIALSGKYATWAGSMLAHDKPIVVLAEEGGPGGARRSTQGGSSPGVSIFPSRISTNESARSRPAGRWSCTVKEAIARRSSPHDHPTAVDHRRDRSHQSPHVGHALVGGGRRR